MIDRQQAHSLGRASGRPGSEFLQLNKDDDQFDESTSDAAKLFGVTAARISQLRQWLRENWEAFQGQQLAAA